MEVVAIKAQAREQLGKVGAKSVRKEGLIPGVINSISGNTHFSVAKMDVRPLIYTPKFKVAEISVDGKVQKCFVKEVQFHPQTDEIVHIDLQALEDGRMINVQVPIELVGKAPGVAIGGKLYQKMRKAKIKTLSENLIDKLVLDVSSLELGDSIRIKDIEGIEGIQIMNQPGIPVASVETPRALRSAQDAAAGEEEGAEGAEGAEGEEGAEGGDAEA